MHRMASASRLSACPSQVALSFQGATKAGDAAVTAAGSRIILPSTHTGSPRAMKEVYNDAMAIITALGQPSLYITLTCYPKWPEVTAELLLGQGAKDRPNLMARVFNLKLKQLLYLSNKQIFNACCPSSHHRVPSFISQTLSHGCALQAN